MNQQDVIVVCDDDAERVGLWAEMIRKVGQPVSEFAVEALEPHVFANAFRGLLQRKAAARMGKGEEAGEAEIGKALQKIDEAAIVVVDYDLTPDADRTPDPVEDGSAISELTGKSGEEFAYLARCFSAAAGIVVVNQKVQSRVFDLTLQQFADSFANVNITSRFLESEALWTGRDGEYRPWSWPRLHDLPATVRRTWGLVADLDQPVLGALGLDDEKHLYAFTQPQLDLFGDEPRQATFRTLAMESEYGLDAKDRSAHVDDDGLRRIAAAAVSRWLEWRVVPGQNVLVDAPHAVQRYPGLLIGDPSDPEAWNATADLSRGNGVIAASEVADAVVNASMWTSRPVWSLPRIAERASQFRAVTGNVSLAFCEDTSRFVDLEAATEIEIAVATPYFQRFIEGVDGVDYSPRRRIRG